MRCIFLDIDGVLNSRDYMLNRRHIPRPTRHAIDAVTVPRLNTITDRTEAKIVISSSWRLQLPRVSPVSRMQCILREHGVTGEIVGVTPYLLEPADGPTPTSCKEQERGHEIQAWLDVHPEVTSFVILDDDRDMAHLAHRHVKTSFELGLLDEHVERAIAMLLEAQRAPEASA